MIWLGFAAYLIGWFGKFNWFHQAAWVRGSFPRFRLARMTSCCVVWLPSQKASGRSDPGFSWCFADSLESMPA